jgi:hypothetical protein
LAGRAPNYPEGIVALTARERELRLIFDQPKTKDLYYYNVNWPKDRSLLIATLDTFDSGNHVVVRRIISDFVKTNTPLNHKIYFAVASERKHTHDEMKAVLQSAGDLYQIVKPILRSRSRFSMILSSRRREANITTLVASTRTKSVIDTLFKTYFYEWYMESIVPFIVAAEDPPSWENQLANLVGPRNKALLSRDTIERSYCTMTTKWEHGIILLSDKIDRPQLDERVHRIAEENGLNLIVEDKDGSRLKS